MNRLKAYMQVLLTGLTLTSLVSSAFAEQFILDDLQTWQFGSARGHLTKRVLWYLDTQNNETNLLGLKGRSPKAQDSSHYLHEGQLLVRPALGYQVNKYLSVWQGYGWAPGFQPKFRNENQIWEQVLLQRHFERIDLSSRTRLEIRRMQGTDGTALRVRDQFRVAVPIRHTKWSVVAYDEPFINLNSVANGPRRGFNQNWAFIGLNRRFNKALTMEVGYLNNYVRNFRPAPDRMNHVIMTTVNMTLN